MKRLAYWLRRVADRIDHEGAPKLIRWSFTFEEYRGIVFREDGRGCPLAYLGDREYERSHDEADCNQPGYNTRRIAELTVKIQRGDLG